MQTFVGNIVVILQVPARIARAVAVVQQIGLNKTAMDVEDQ